MERQRAVVPWVEHLFQCGRCGVWAPPAWGRAAEVRDFAMRRTHRPREFQCPEGLALHDAFLDEAP